MIGDFINEAGKDNKKMKESSTEKTKIQKEKEWGVTEYIERLEEYLKAEEIFYEISSRDEHEHFICFGFKYDDSYEELQEFFYMIGLDDKNEKIIGGTLFSKRLLEGITNYDEYVKFTAIQNRKIWSKLQIFLGEDDYYLQIVQAYDFPLEEEFVKKILFQVRKDAKITFGDLRHIGKKAMNA